MLITLSFPIADYRMFIQEDTHRLDLVDISEAADYGKGYFRSFGGFSRRYAQHHISQPNESTYAKADNGIRFDRLRRKKPPVDAFKGHFDCVFRRAFFNHYSARFDIGLTNQSRKCYGIGPEGIESIIHSALNLYFYVSPNKIDNAIQNDNQHVRAVAFGSILKKKYILATTRRPTENIKAVRENWISNRLPVVLCQIDGYESWWFDRYVEYNYIEISLPKTWGLRLFYKVINESTIPVWVIVKDWNTDKERLRALRIWLLKWHQEKQTFFGLIHYIGHIRETHDGAENSINIPKVADCLNSLLKTLGKKKKYGIPADEIANAIKSIDEQIDRNSYDEFLRFIEENPSTKYLKERLRTNMKNINMSNNHGTVNIEVIEGNKVVINNEGNNNVNLAGKSSGSTINEFFSDVKGSLDQDALSKENHEEAMKQLNKIENMIMQKEKPSMIKKALDRLMSFLIDLGATTASTLIQMKLKDLF